jgi:uncharacterized protein (DUF433 family)
MRRGKEPVGESPAEEAMRCRRFPGIAFRGSDWDRRAWVVGTSLDVWEIVDAFLSYEEVEPMAVESDLTERQIKLALAYNDEYREEIEAAVEENRRPLDDLRRAYPTIDVIEVHQ